MYNRRVQYEPIIYKIYFLGDMSRFVTLNGSPQFVPRSRSPRDVNCWLKRIDKVTPITKAYLVLSRTVYQITYLTNLKNNKWSQLPTWGILGRSDIFENAHEIYLTVYFKLHVVIPLSISMCVYVCACTCVRVCVWACVQHYRQHRSILMYWIMSQYFWRLYMATSYFNFTSRITFKYLS